MKTLILLLALILAPLTSDEEHEVRLAMPHTHHLEKTKKIGHTTKRKYYLTM